MSSSALKLLAASGAKGDPVYVDDVFSTDLWKGAGSSTAITITNGIDLAGEGGLVWGKKRNAEGDHQLTDTVRGVRKELRSNAATVDGGAEGTNGDVSAFNADGFSLSAGAGNLLTNNKDFVAWTFRKQPGFFDIVTYTGNGSNGHAISHNLGSAPGMIIVKSITTERDWWVYHISQGNDRAAQLNGGGYAFNTGYNYFNSTTPTATNFTVSNNSEVNQSGQTYVAYLFAHDAQDFGTDSDEAIIKCGTYTGNGSTTGPIIDLGFEPQWLLFKNATATSDWSVYDVMRGITFRAGAGTGDDALLNINSTASESAPGAVNINPNGFQLKGGQTSSNANGATHIYMAIRRPFKPAEEFAATNLFSVTASTNTTPMYVSGFPADMTINKYVTDTSGPYIWSRLTQDQRLNTSTAGQQSTDAGFGYFAFSNGMTKNGYDGVSTDRKAYLWRRAPGYFDVVAYNGTGSATTIPHNLGVAPEMIWHKVRTATGNWELYLNAGGTEYGYYGLDQKYVGLNTSLSSWNNTSPTDSVVSISSGLSNASHSYIMYLFASVPGISKIGTYSGTGSEFTVDCGFSAGARFVLIKRADNSMGAGGESYFVFDTARGITSSSSPYFPLNDEDAQTTGSFIKPSSGGFIVTTASVVNTNGSTYAFYAIA